MRVHRLFVVDEAGTGPVHPGGGLLAGGQRSKLFLSGL